MDRAWKTEDIGWEELWGHWTKLTLQHDDPDLDLQIYVSTAVPYDNPTKPVLGADDLAARLLVFLSSE